MQKTRLGVSVGLMGAAVVFATFFGGYIPSIMLVGYVLLFEENVWLRRNSVKALALLMFFGVVFEVIGLIPDVFGWVDSLVRIFNGNFSYTFISNVIGFITNTISVLKTVVFLLLGVKSLTQGTVKIPVVDNMLNKYL